MIQRIPPGSRGCLPGRARRARWLVALAAMSAMLAGVSACGGAPPRPDPLTANDTYTDWHGPLVPAVVGCFAAHDLIPAALLRAAASWLRHGQVTENAAFHLWWWDNSSVRVSGVARAGLTLDEQLFDWVDYSTTTSQDWPVVCGPLPRPPPGAVMAPSYLSL